MASRNQHRAYGRKLVYRIPLPLPVAHWLIALALFILPLTGRQIFNAHPAVYWGNASEVDRQFLSFGADGGAFPSWITLPAEQDLACGGRWRFFFAWCLVAGLGAYFAANLIGGRIERDLLRTRNELCAIGRSVLDHRSERRLRPTRWIDQTLPIAHGPPLRLRLERQLGYKMARYIMRLGAIESFASINGGQVAYWEDRGYEWYAGI